MTIYLALLRGINVGGHNKLKMAELRTSLESLGLQNVKTYIQSGNVLFGWNDGAEILHKQIESKIEEDFGISSAVIIRTKEELQEIINHCPFSEQDISKAASSAKGESLHVALLQEIPSNEGIDKLSACVNEREQCAVNGRNIYLLFHDSIRNSKLGNQLNKIGVPATVRNWKTLNKLLSMSEELD
ncbi:DUF1697 domain-containing protein [Jeotgalibacillus sp. S-D1]|uniref:DUF1697 domain-containing protein n=1 Tax=Jeotgalibacillus sp. S-D1 TaxID=2552189 RepID=UPI00105A2B37|nr:DUF1697 domain-containing protein [Jeotgalibacillus sp. S-D1]TDL31277.1 DUF1697 domain-containing protein [Jeotgalibacillus sp. S-D1]